MTKYIFYKISCLDETINNVYIGSTTNFTKRKSRHKINSINNENDKNYNFPIYKFIRENGGWVNFKMVPIEEAEFESKLHAHIREQELFEKYKNKLNSINAYTNQKEYKKEYRELNKEKIKESKKEYRETNKEKIKEYQKQYRELNKKQINKKDANKEFTEE